MLMNNLDLFIKIAKSDWITTHDCTLKNGRRVNVLKLINHVKKNFKPVSLNINDIKEVYRSKRSGFSKKRYGTADSKFPIIVDENLTLIDGRHRTLKQRDLGKRKVKAYVVPFKIINKLT